MEDSKKFNKEIRDLKKSISSKKEERDTLNSEIQQAVKEKSKLRMTKNDLIETLNGKLNIFFKLYFLECCKYSYNATKNFIPEISFLQREFYK